MSKKDPFYEREKAKYGNPIPSREYILECLESRLKPANFPELASELGLGDDEEAQEALRYRLRAMERDGQIFFNRAKRYAIPEQAGLVKGSVIGHRDGHGFLDIDGEKRDAYIPHYEMKSLLHGDRILAKVMEGSRGKGKLEARVVQVIEGRKEAVVGRYFLEYGIAVVVPDDDRICQDIIIPQGQQSKAEHGQVVVAELTQRPSKRVNAVGKITEVLGEHMSPGLEVEMALRNHDIPHEWPSAVTRQANKFGKEVPESAKEGRVDLRDLPLITIDGEDARDFDDAVYCERKRSGGWRLWVAIADVSSYVTRNSALDKEAINRGNSVYFPDMVVPMLPENLSNGLCSLNPDVDRLCLVCEMTVSERGKLSGYRFYEAVMRSHARMTYTNVSALLQGDKRVHQEYDHLAPQLYELHGMFKALKHNRHERGAIEFETLETRFIFDAHRKIDRIVPVVRNDAHMIIEECMILANICAARFLTKHEAAGLYRVHETPDPEKLSNFRAFLGELGVESKLQDEPTPLEVMTELEKVSTRPDIELIQTMLLRSMKQAVYQEENIGHFGLALTEYAHFTSPIRRYPDLVVHRAIKAVLETQEQQCTGAFAYTVEEADNLGQHCSMTERRADNATREVADWLKCEYMQDHIGTEFEAVISSVTNFGFFARISDLHIDGLVHVTSLENDYYLYDSERHLLIGERTRKVYRMGDKVEIRVASVNLEQRKIDFVLASSSADQIVEGEGPKRRALRKGKVPSSDQPSRSKTKDEKPKKKKSKTKRKPAEKGRSGSTEKKKGKPAKKRKRPGKNARKRVNETKSKGN